MSEIAEALPPIAPAGADMSQATKETASALYAKAGYSQEQIAAAGYAGTPATVPTVQAPAVTNVAGTNTQVVTPNDGLTPDQRLSGFRAAYKYAADKEAVVAAAAGAGISREQLGAEPPDLADIAAQQREAETPDTYAAPADANGYQLQYGSIAQNSGTAELAALNADVTSAFASAGVPAALAQGLLDGIIETGEQYASESMTDAGRELRYREEGALFKKLSADPAENLRLATLAYNALPKSFRDQLDANLALHSARAQLQLAAVGRALEYRASKRKG